MAVQSQPIFSPDIPPDLEHAPLMREEALEWLERQFSGNHTFSSGDLLRMVGDQNRRWLIGRLRSHGIAEKSAIALPDAADALTVLLLRSRGVKFRDAIDAILARQEQTGTAEPRYSGIWNRLVITALDRLRRRVPPRLLGAAVFSLLDDQKDHANALVVIRQLGLSNGNREPEVPDVPTHIEHDDVYQTILDLPAPSCSIIAPARELVTLGDDRPPARSEITSRTFTRVYISTARETYELMVGTLHPAAASLSQENRQLVGRLLDLAFLDFEEFSATQASTRFEAESEPESGSTHDLQLWLMTRFLDHAFPGSLSEINAHERASGESRILASSVVNPWEPSRWDPPKTLEMLSGYVSRIGVPLVVQRVEQPWTGVIASVEPELRYLQRRAPSKSESVEYSAISLPVFSSTDQTLGALYLLTPEIAPAMMDVEVRTLTILSRVVGETMERLRAAAHSADLSADVATMKIHDQQQFRSALLNLLQVTANRLQNEKLPQLDSRLPFLLLSAHEAETGDHDPASSDHLKSWLAQTLRHLEWRSFVRTHSTGIADERGPQSFIGELRGAGMLIALDVLVTKDELDRIRNDFPTMLNLTEPSNAPVKLVGWVLDVPAQRVLDSAARDDLEALADDVESWAFDVATVVDDVAQSDRLAHEDGEWDASLKRVRRALRKEGGRKNGFLYRLAADCSFSLGDWPSALRYAQEGVDLSRKELGSGFVRSILQAADAHICLVDPLKAWEMYSSALGEAPSHPLPPYYRGQASLLIARLLHEYEIERLRSGDFVKTDSAKVDAAVQTLISGGLEDLTASGDLLDGWGLIPTQRHYRNFHIVPTLQGQGLGYLLTGMPGPAASRMQSARRAFPKDDLFFREYLFAKCWEQGVHRAYGELALSPNWQALADRIASKSKST